MPQPRYLQSVRELCRVNGAVLIFDEVITGFRMSLGGAQEWFGVTPDIATFGKALAGGITLSAIAGRRDIFDLMFGGGVVYGGTFNGNPFSLAGAKAALTELSRDRGQPLRRANEMGEQFHAGS